MGNQLYFKVVSLFLFVSLIFRRYNGRLDARHSAGVSSTARGQNPWDILVALEFD